MYNTHLVDYLHTIPGFADFLREFFEDHFEEFQAIYGTFSEQISAWVRGGYVHNLGL